MKTIKAKEINGQWVITCPYCHKKHYCNKSKRYKVYCSKCKYFDMWFTCYHPSTKHIKDNWNKKKILWGNAFKINADNKCKLYKEINLWEKILRLGQ